MQEEISLLTLQITILTTGYDVTFNDIVIKCILAIVKETLVMGHYHNTSHSFPPLKV